MNVLPRYVKRYLRLSLLPNLVGLLLFFAASAANAASFTPLSTFAYTAGYGFSVTQLTNGKVLLAGGTDGTAIFATVALFDPASGTLTTQDATLGTARYNHTATLLRDGRVLIAGGTTTGGTFLATTEIYDPATGTVAAGPTMNAPHSGHTATLLADGRILITGGNAGNSLEVADASASGFTTITDNGIARFGHTATVLPDGRVLIAGGSIGGSAEASAEIFNPADNSLTATGSLQQGRGFHTATLLTDGSVLLIGGTDGTNPLDTGEVYFPDPDPALGGFSYIGPLLNNARFAHSATLLPNGTVLIAGGWDGSTPLGSAEIYDVVTDSITPEAAPLDGARYEHTATLLPSGDVFITGGHDSTGEIYSYATPATPASPTPADLSTPHAYGTATLLPDGRVLIAGGNDTVETRAVELYDPPTGQVLGVSALTTARYRHTATLLANGRILIAGGAYYTDGDTSISAVEIYDPVTRVSISLPPLSVARSSHTATLLPDGRVLVAGGIDDSGNFLDSADLFNPATGTFTTITMTSHRGEHAATLMADGRVLITGGRLQSGGPLKTAEVFDPATNSFSTLSAKMVYPRKQHFSLPLADGTVLVAFGYDQSGYTQWTAEIFDPITGTFTETSNQPSRGHVDGTATVLADGRVLFADGYHNFSATSYAKDIYNPATRSFLPPITETARNGQMATLLPDGTVLLSSDTGSRNFNNGLFALDLGYTSAVRPVVSGISTAGGRITAIGSGFRGISEASSGSKTSSAANYPLLRLQRLADGAIKYLAVDPAIGWSGTSFASVPLANMPLGHYLASVVVNGVPSIGKVIRIDRNLAAVPEAVDFFDGTIGVPVTKSVTLTNSGSAALTVNTATIGGIDSARFTVDTTSPGLCGAIPFAIPAGSSCSITVTFSPTASGKRDATLDLATTDLIAPSLSVPLQGDALPLRHLLTLTVTGPATGSVNSTPTPDIACAAGTCSQVYPDGTTVTLTATPGANASIGWTGCDSITGSSNEICTVAMSAAKNVTATFNYVSTFTIGTSVTPFSGGSISPSTSQTVALNGTLTATITVNSGWHIKSVGFNPGTLVPGTATPVAGQPGNYTYTTPAVTASGTIEVVFEPGAFASVGTMTQNRIRPISVLLNDGRILITGGQTMPDGLITAEIYDPVTNTTTATGNMTTSRREHAAILLPNGKVLVTGGSNGPYNTRTFLNTAELYDPTTGTFSAAPNMVTIRAGHTMTLLADGTVLIAGGINGTSTPSNNTAEIYDPVTNTFAATTQTMKATRSNHTATRLPDGTVLIAGGNTNTGFPRLATAELYDPVAKTFTFTTGNMTAQRDTHTATLLANGLVLISGGVPSYAAPFLTSAELYDPAAQTFTATGSMKVARGSGSNAGHCGTLLPNGKVLVAGGSYGAVATEIFDPSTGTFSNGGDMTKGREFVNAILLPDGRVVMIGEDLTNTIDLYSYAATSATTAATTGNMTTTRDQHSAVLYSENGIGKVLIAGGSGAGAGSAEVYTPANGTFTATANAMTTSRPRPTMVLLRNGMVLVAGGVGTDKTADTYNYVNSTTPFNATGNTMQSGHYGGTGTLLPDGRVLIAGGYDGTTDTAVADIYISVTNTFNAAPPSMTVGRTNHTATLLPDGRVLIVGGQGMPAGTYYDTAEIFDPATGAFTLAAGKLSTKRYSHAAVLLPDGKVLIVGGTTGTGITPPAEIYDPASDTFTALASNLNWNDTVPPQAVLLQNGTVLIVRGADRSDIYDPATRTFIPTATRGGGYNNESVTLLPDGTVLMAGGYDGALSTATAKIYNPGLGFAAGRRPVMPAVPDTAISGSALVVTPGTGTRFLGDSEAAGGTSTGPSSGVPVARLQRVESGQALYLQADAANSWSSTTFRSAPSMIMPGHYLATIYASGVPSTSVLLVLDPNAMIRPYPRQISTAVDLDAVVPVVTELTIFNDGKSAGVTVNNLTIGGADSNFFAVQPGSCGTLPFTLSSGQNCKIGIAFLPPSNIAANLGNRSAALTITSTGSDDTALDTIAVPLTGTVTTTAKVTFAGTGTGYVWVSPTAHFSGFSYTTTTGTSMQLSAYADAGSAATWSGCDSIDAVDSRICNITIPASKTPTITFDLIPYAINATVFSGSGTATPQSPTVTVNNTGAVDITPAIGYQIAAITDNGSQVPFTPTQGGSTYTYSIVNVQQDHTVEVTFAPGSTALLAVAQDQREFQTVSPLPDGRLLLAGGQDDQGRALNSARIFDPTTGTSTATGTMTAARVYHTATPLPDGRVLITGGNDGANALQSAEIYDPATGTFTATGSMAFPRDAHTATLLPDGTVLIAGGGTAQLEIYDGLSGTFTAPPSAAMAADRNYHTATLMADGLVLIAGGWDGTHTLDTAEFYDPIAGAIIGSQTMNSPRDGHSATLLPNNSVLLIGGDNGQGAVASAEVYDGAFTATASMTWARDLHSATLLPSGKVLVAGGWDGINALGTMEIYDYNTAVFLPAGSLKTPRLDHTATILPGGRVVFAGGWNGSLVLNSIEFFSPGTSSFQAGSPMADMRGGAASATLPDGTVLVVGGDGGDGSYLDTAEVYSLAGSFTATAPMSVTRAGATATLLTDGTVLVTGGDSTPNITSSTEVYIPATGTFDTAIAAPMTAPRSRHTATLLADSRVLITGGRTDSFGTVVDTAEIYDPADGSFTPTAGLMSQQRESHTATLLADGTVLIAGGNDTAGSPLSSAEIYNPVTDTFTPVSAALLTGITGHSATLLPNGRVLITGGMTGGGSATGYAALFNPADSSFSTVADGGMTYPRAGHSGTLLPDGRVLLTGGWDPATSTNVLAAEIYDPAASSFSAGPSLAEGRRDHTARLLPDGRILMAGGFVDSVGSTTSSELFDLGLGTNPARQPAISGITLPPASAARIIRIAGTGFVETTTGATGSFASSASAYPMVQLTRIDSGATRFITPATGISRSATAFDSAAVNNLQEGPYRLTVYTNGVASLSSIIAIDQYFAGFPVLAVTPATPNLGAVTIGGNSSLFMTLQNNGSGSLNISNIAISGTDYTLDVNGGVNPCGTTTPTFAAGAFCTVGVVLTPTTAATLTGSLTITSDDPVNPTTTVSLTGTGVTSPTFTVTPTAGTGGTISPPNPQGVVTGTTTSFTIMSDTANGYSIASVSGCGGTWTGTNPYITGAITADCTVTATFAQASYTVTPTAGTGGTISAATPQTVSFGGTTSFTITADTANGYHVDSVSGCGGTWTGTNPFVTGAITGNCTVTASFALDTFPATLQAAGGTIGGPTTVTYGTMPTYTIAADGDHKITNVTVNGVAVGAVTSYTFTTPVIGAVSVVATFGAIADGDITQGDGLPAGQVSIADALKALRIAVGLITATPQDLLHGDVAPLVGGVPSPDGRIDHRDALVLLRKVVGLVNW